MSENQKIFSTTLVGLVITFVLLYVFTFDRLVPARVAEIVPTEVGKIIPTLISQLQLGVNFTGGQVGLLQEAGGNVTCPYVTNPDGSTTITCTIPGEIPPTVIPPATGTLAATLTTLPPGRGTPSVTPAPGNTATPGATSTPPAQVTPTPGPGAHNPNVWHGYDAGHGHGHGVNPFDCDPRLNDKIQEHMDTYRTFGYPWQTFSENETAHNGYFFVCVRAEVQGDGCIKFEGEGSPIPENANCVSVALLLLHSDGSGPHDRKAIHSQVFWGIICAENLTSCGVHYQGGQSNYGTHQLRYKDAQCLVSPFRPFYYNEAGEKILYPDSLLDLPPYHFTTDPDRGDQGAVVDWSGARVQPNALFFPGDPNYSLQLGWATMNAQVFVPNNQATCIFPEFDIPTGEDADIIRVTRIFIPIDRFPQTRPLSMWIDNLGHPNPACIAAGPIPDTTIICSPYFNGVGVPANDLPALWQFRAGECGAPETAPCVDLNPGDFPASTATPPPG